MNCKATTATGAQCRSQPLKGGEYCFIHAPETGRARAEARKRGGENRHTPHAGDVDTIPADITTIADTAPIVRYVLDELLTMDNSVLRARAMLQCVETFAKVFQIGELEARIAALEMRIR